LHCGPSNQVTKQTSKLLLIFGAVFLRDVDDTRAKGRATLSIFLQSSNQARAFETSYS
jgi:hypothetical protein